MHGLRISPKLCQQHLGEVLRQQNLRQCKADRCLWTTPGPVELESTPLDHCPCSCAWPTHLSVCQRSALCRWRPYRVESTRSLPTSEVKQPRAWLVVWWGTTWEDQGAASFCLFSFSWPIAPHCPLSNRIDRTITWHFLRHSFLYCCKAYASARHGLQGEV